MKQQIKDLVLLLQRLWSLLWRGFGPGLGNYHTLWGGPKEKKNTRQMGKHQVCCLLNPKCREGYRMFRISIKLSCV